MNFTENELELAYLEVLEDLGWECVDGRELERGDHHSVVLEDNLRDAVNRINKDMPSSSREEAIRKVMLLSHPNLIKSNEEFHNMLVNGVDVGEYNDKDGNKRSGGKIYLIDFKNKKNNEFQAINQFTIVGRSKRRPDIILFVNGLPLVVI
ncbi:MAG: type I restriction endonuclease, partial [Fusobacteriaceae bacterium]